MTEFRTVRKNGRLYRIPVRQSSGSDRFIEGAVRHPGRVREYIERTYGSEGFNENGSIRMEYLEMAKKKAEESHNRSLVDAIDLAIRLKQIKKNE